ncbi:VirD4-like conjugal transfer protein, CD1115 family [Desulfolucanica intricata]|uniref:VirD4-like conjugal transfer protein, CD1115 family n=1 Tax=Desulfolucanica intricata TaxID=1285191 RepID=UPI0008330E94|nr:type IV secretory system conjugative DNA transfer family protein [Desulfolucanica intricata]
MKDRILNQANDLVDKLPGRILKRWINKHKKAALLLGSLPVTVPLFYFADVWILGTAAAAVHDFQTWLSENNILPISEQKATAVTYTKLWPWYFTHPFRVGWDWLTKPTEALTFPGIKNIWQLLNTILGAGSVTTYFLQQLKRRQNKVNSPQRVHGLKVVSNAAMGTARWASRKDIHHLCEFGPPVLESKCKHPGGIVLGKLKGQIVRVMPGKSPKGMPGLAGHAAIFGGTGSGKSFSFVLNNIIAAVADGQSFICTDPKGELAATTAQWLRNKGYHVKIFNLINPATSHRWNAITECRDDAEIAEMAACLVNNAGKDAHTYFLAKEIQLLEALVGLLRGDFPTEQQHLRAVMSLTAWTKEELEARFKAAFQTHKISSTIYERWRGVASANLEHAVSGLSAKLKILTTEPLAALLSEQEINLSEIGSQKTALFCVLPVSGENKVLRPILATFYMFLFKRLYVLAEQHDGRLPVSVRLILDEFANIGQIPGFSEIISTARSLGIQIQFILQGRSQLDDVYGAAEAQNILSNCPTMLLLGLAPGDQETAVMFSRILGKAAVEGKFEKEDLTIPLVHYFKPAEKTQNVIKRLLMEPDEIARMHPLDCIAIVQWCYPLYLKKVGWVKLPQAKDIKQTGNLPVCRLAPPRNFNVSLPEVVSLEQEPQSEPQKLPGEPEAEPGQNLQLLKQVNDTEKIKISKSAW